MQQVNIHGPGDVRIDTIPEPEIGPADVLLKIDACGICGSDLSYAKYGLQRPGGEPWPLGHEAAGTIVKIGAQVRDLPVGLRAVINPMGAHDNVIGNGGSEGAFADYLLVRNAVRGTSLLPIPDSMPAERAALVEPLAVALHGVNQAKLRGDEQVVVLGAGPIGLGAVFWLKRRGIKSIVSVDLSAERLARAQALGATDIINPGTENLAARLIQLHGEHPSYTGSPATGTDVFLDMAGAPPLLQNIISLGKLGSRLVLTAVYGAPVEIDLQSLLLREMAITPAVGYPTELPEVLATLATVSAEDLAPYISHRYAFPDFVEAFATARTPASAKVMVVF